MKSDKFRIIAPISASDTLNFSVDNKNIKNTFKDNWGSLFDFIYDPKCGRDASQEIQLLRRIEKKGGETAPTSPGKKSRKES